MKLKAKMKWSGEQVLIKPVFFAWHVGMQFKTLTGYGANSFFCNGAKDFVFPLETKLILFFLKIGHWGRMWLWMQIRYWVPNKVKRAFIKKRPGYDDDDLPF